MVLGWQRRRRSNFAGVRAERDAEAKRADAAEGKLRQQNLSRRGRKSGHAAGQTELESKWDGMGAEARRRAMLRYTHDIALYLEEEALEWELNAFANVLKWFDLIPDLLLTRHFLADSFRKFPGGAHETCDGALGAAAGGMEREVGALPQDRAQHF
eukprot:3863228-Pleurochrysis_carterae.AAC.1